jgi:hypothetical protein
MRDVYASLAVTCLAAGCPRAGAPPATGERDTVVDRLERYREQSLAPAKIPPPSLDAIEVRVEHGSVVGVARVVSPEDAAWNRWVDGGPRLFNDRAAVVFDLHIDGRGPVTWDPGGTLLEVNDERTVLGVAASAEVLLAELLFHAYLEEQWAVPGDLVNRTRGAGPFRSAYLAAIGDTGLAGVVAFPLGAETPVHVVAMRLTMLVTDDEGRHELIWVFE